MLILAVCGCATNPYRYGRFHPDSPGETDLQPVRIVRGEPNKTLDRLGNILGIKDKILPMSNKVNNHHVTDETLEKLVEYLEKNDLTDVYVTVNHYAPKEQWRLLRENDRISPGWKYTAGTFTWLNYTIIPNRLFGGDHYNPFTNTLYVNSDVPAKLICEAAYAKDIHGRKYPGLYAVFVNDLPVLNLWRQSRAVNDTLGYAQTEADWPTEKQTYRIMYPHIGAGALGETGMVIASPFSGPLSFVFQPILGFGGALVGHAVGRTVIARREAEVNQQQAPDQEPLEDPGGKVHLVHYVEDEDSKR